MYTDGFGTLIVKGQNGRSLSVMPCMRVEKTAALVKTTVPYPQSKCAIYNPRLQCFLYPKRNQMQQLTTHPVVDWSDIPFFCCVPWLPALNFLSERGECAEKAHI